MEAWLHNGYVGYPPQGSMFFSETFTKSPAAAGFARELLDRMRGQIPEDTLDDARLLISELVANAVEHVEAAGDLEVSVALENGRLRVEVLDPPALRAAMLEAAQALVTRYT